MKKKLSVIVLTYNHADYIEENLRGIFMQNVDFPIELILCDDKSPDNTHERIQEILVDTPAHIEVKYTHHEKNIGSTPNFYYALKQVTGDYIAFCEGDDYWTNPSKLQKQFDFLESNPSYSICFHQAMNVSPYPEFHNKPFSIVENRDYTPLEIYQHWVVHTATVMMKAETLKTDAFQKTMTDPTLVYFDTILFLASTTIGKIRGFCDTMSAYRRHDAGLSFGNINLKRDLRHNHLDNIIGNYYQGKIKNYAQWLIFKRSKIGVQLALKKGDWSSAFSFLKWILKDYKKLIIYILKKIKS